MSSGRRGHDDERIIARGFDEAGLEGFRAGAGHGLTDGHRARIGHAMRLAAGDQPLTDARAAGDDLNQPRRQRAKTSMNFSVVTLVCS